jgi:hypothetical protein
VKSGDGGVLHVTSGDAAVPFLRAAGIEGEILPWRDVLHEGPVLAVPDAALRDARARFLSGRGWVAYEKAVADLEARDRALAAAGRLVLWFEQDLYDQLQLVQVLASSDAPAELAQAETYLDAFGRAGLTPAAVSDGQRRFARRAWAGLRAPHPSGLETLAGEDDADLPFLRAAVVRLLEEYPAVENGLGRSERQAVQAVADGAATRVEAFEVAQEGEEARFMGDTSFFALLERLEPLVGRDPGLRLTELGARVLTAEADFVTPRWIGGVSIEPFAPAWRWDGAHRRLVTMLAA